MSRRQEVTCSRCGKVEFIVEPVETPYGWSTLSMHGARVAILHDLCEPCAEDIDRAIRDEMGTTDD